MTTNYYVQVLHLDRQAWADELAAAVAVEVHSLGVHKSVQVIVGPAAPPGHPNVAVYLGSGPGAVDPALMAAVRKALDDAVTVIPVVEALVGFAQHVPDILRPVNGWEWAGAEPAMRLARWLLEELGIEERQRSVFISHKRDDGLYAAEQLFDELSKHGFDPFIDRFGIRAAEDVQARIADALEAKAFLLLLETPLAHTSEWVFDEVDYALTHTMGIHIIRWPGDVTEVAGSNRLPRQQLATGDLQMAGAYEGFADPALEAILAEVEAAHAGALVRRRRQLLRNVEDAAEANGMTCTPLPGWRLLVEGPTRRDIVGVAGRLPEVDDLYALDLARVATVLKVPDPGAVLVHSARQLRPERRQVLEWASGVRPLALVPENAIGGYWSP